MKSGLSGSPRLAGFARLVLLPFLLLLGAGLAAAQEVRVAVAYYSAATGPYFEKMAQEFEKANPGLKIKIETVNWDSMLQKLQTDITGGANPDIAIIATLWLNDFVRDSVVEPLDTYMDAKFRDRFIGAFLSPSRIGGKVYGLPIAASARGLYYNKDLLTKAGFPNGPQTWDDVIKASQKLKAEGVAGFGLQGKEIETDVYWYYSLYTHGGDLLDKNNKAGFASAAGVKALKLYKQLIDEGLTQPNVTNYTREDLQNLFKQGRLGMVITAPFLVKQIRDEAPNLKFGIAPIPRGTNDATYGVTDSIVLFKNSKVKPAAWKFLDYLFTKAPRVAFTSGEGFLPTTKDEAADPAFNDPNTQVFVKMLPNAHFAPTISGLEDAKKDVIDALQSVYLGKAQPEAALKAAAASADSKLGK